MWTGIIVGVFGAISTDSWPTLWMMMEINLIRFLPIITLEWSSKKRALLYFIVQSIGSLGVLLGGLFSDWLTITVLWVAFGLLLKASLAPFQFWGCRFICSVNRLNAFLFLTLQKLTPLIFLYVSTTKNILLIVILLNVFASMSRIGSKMTVLFLFFTGLIHMSWILSATFWTACWYFVLYVLITIPLFRNSSSDLTLMILNMAGLPPITGFFMKLGVLQCAGGGLGLTLLIFSMLHLFAYMRQFIIGATCEKGLRALTITTCCLGLLTSG